MNRRLGHRWVRGSAAVVLVGASAVFSLASSSAGAANDPTTLSGEGGTFLQPVVTRLVHDSKANLNGLFGAYVATGLDTGISDFVGSAPNSFSADFAVSERPLTTSEVATAKANGRSFEYVPFAATPVAIGTIVTNTSYSGEDPIPTSDLCPHINMRVQDLGAVWGIDASPVNSWSDQRFTCSNGMPLSAQGTQRASNDDPTMANYALMALLNSDSAAKHDFQVGVNSAFAAKTATTTDITPAERLPYTGFWEVAGGDDPFLGGMLTVNATTNVPRWQVNVGTASVLGLSFPVSSVWAGAPLGAAWDIPTAALQNAALQFVAPSVASATAAEGDATLAHASDPMTNNLVTFSASSSDATAYNNYLMEESYLVVPTSTLPAAKASALADLIRFVLGPTGQGDIASFGAAPATAAMDAAGLQVASQLDVEAAQSAATTTSTTTAGSSGTTTTTGVPGAGAAAGGGSSSTGGSSTGGSSGNSGPGGSGSSGLAYTGGPDLAPLLGTGALMLVAGSLVRRRLRRRPKQS